MYVPLCGSNQINLHHTFYGAKTRRIWLKKDEEKKFVMKKKKKHFGGLKPKIWNWKTKQRQFFIQKYLGIFARFFEWAAIGEHKRIFDPFLLKCLQFICEKSEWIVSAGKWTSNVHESKWEKRKVCIFLWSHCAGGNERAKTICERKNESRVSLMSK